MTRLTNIALASVVVFVLWLAIRLLVPYAVKAFHLVDGDQGGV